MSDDRRFSRERLQAELEAVAERHGLTLVKRDGLGVFLDSHFDMLTVALVPRPVVVRAPDDARVEGCERPCCKPTRST